MRVKRVTMLNVVRRKGVCDDPHMEDASSTTPAKVDLGLLADLQHAVNDMANEWRCHVTADLLFLAFLRRERGSSPGPDQHEYSDDYVRFSRVLMHEVGRSGHRRIDELHFLLAFMRFGEGLPGRVFGELGVSPEQVETYGRRGVADVALEKLYSPEEVADYLGVHVQTVRTWIRTGKLPARRLAGQRALRIRASDVERVLEPLDTAEGDG
jgi:excisionase family DNA binding protein